MGEIEALLRDLCADRLELRVAERLAYREVFRRHVGLDPLAASFADLVARARSLELPEAEILCGEHRPAWLDLLFSYFVQPKLGAERISFVYDYPAILPSLARRCAEQPDLVERVEVFLGGLEIGNGFYELADAGEQTARFERDRVERQRNGLFVPDRDERLLAALRAGLPDCAGVAIGLDRLLMLLTGSESIDDVLAFPIERA
jgi:lysyl-tRNA synthetase class 2